MANLARPIQAAHVSVLLVSAVVVFLVCASVTGGVYLYVHSLEKKVASLDEEIKEGKASFDIGSIKSIKRLETRINAATAVLDTHTAFSKFFTLLEESTIPTVAFRSLKYSVTDGVPTVTLIGVCDGVYSLALQADTFLERPEFQEQSFGQFKADDEKKEQEFTFTAKLDPKVIRYTAGSVDESDTSQP